MRSRGLLIVSTTTAMVLAPAAAAFAGPGSWVDVDNDGSEIEVGATDGSDAPATSGSSGSDSPCTWTRVPDDEVQSVWWEAGSEVADGELVDPADYAWYYRTCPDGGGGTTSTLIPVPRDVPAVDPEDLADEAVEQLVLPRPTIAMNPTGLQVVHVPSWLWIDDAIWRQHTESASAGSVTTTATARPRQVTWDLGNGQTVVCDGPGVAYDPRLPSAEQSTYCSHTYVHTSAGQPDDAYTVTATVEWTVSWSAVGADGGGPLPALFTSAPVQIRVAEMQALNQ